MDLKRCMKCGTEMASARKVCAICGWNAASPGESVDKLARVAPAVDPHAGRAKRSEKMICPECMNSFGPEEFAEVGGRKICQGCATVMEKKSKKPAAKKEDSKT